MTGDFGRGWRPRVSVTRAGVDAALTRAVHEVLVTSTVDEAGDGLGDVRAVDHENLRRGVRYRLVVPDRGRLAGMATARLAAFALSGAKVRTVPEVPVDALVIDRRVAVLPKEGGGVAVIDLPSVVTTTAALFERLWDGGVPFAADDIPDDPGLSARERDVLVLLAAGLADEPMAVRLGISVRTVRRLISSLMYRLGARSRFQAGVKAVHRGWLGDRPEGDRWPPARQEADVNR